MLAARDLSVSLGARDVLHGVSVAVNEGEMLGLVGPNGAGKTTLLRALIGLVPAASGEVLVDGQPFAAVSRRVLARDIGYLPQGGRPHWPLPVEDLVMLGRLPHRDAFARAGDADRTAVRRAMEAVGVAEFAARPATALSGGEQARVLLARALAGEPRLLLADEPIAGLDPYHRLEVMEHLAALAERGMGVVVVLHDLTLASRFCGRLVLIDDGRVIADGAPGEVLSPERLAEVYRVSAIAGREGDEGFIVPWTRLTSPAD